MWWCRHTCWHSRWSTETIIMNKFVNKIVSETANEKMIMCLVRTHVRHRFYTLTEHFSLENYLVLRFVSHEQKKKKRNRQTTDISWKCSVDSNGICFSWNVVYSFKIPNGIIVVDCAVDRGITWQNLMKTSQWKHALCTRWEK